MIRLIVNGDDFGSSSGVNRAMIRAYQDGILTSSSLMTGEAGFEEAVRMVQDAGGPAVGLHVTAVLGRSVLKASEIPTIVDGEGRFASDPVKAGLLYFFSRKARAELASEIRAQFERFLSTGLTLTHVDSHTHLHLHPVLFDIMVGLCGEFGVRRMRVPEDDLGLAARPGAGCTPEQRGAALLFKVFTRRMKARLAREGFVFPRRVLGHLLTGRMDKAYVLRMIDQLPGGDFEIYFHPELPEENERGDAVRLQGYREFGLLVDPDVKARIQRRSIQLIHYGQLNRNS